MGDYSTHQLIALIADGAFQVSRMSNLGRHMAVAMLEVDLRESLGFGQGQRCQPLVIGGHLLGLDPLLFGCCRRRRIVSVLLVMLLLFLLAAMIPQLSLLIISPAAICIVKKKIADTKKRKKKETRFLFFVLYNRRNNRNNSGPFTLCILGSRNCCEPSIQFRPGFGFTQRNRFKQTAGANNTKSYLFISRTSFYFFTGSRRNSDFHWVYCFLDAIRISMDFECV
jgi:hypothetical protein